MTQNPSIPKTVKVSIWNVDKFIGLLLLHSLSRIVAIVIFAITFFPNHALIRLARLVRWLEQQIHDMQ